MKLSRKGWNGASQLSQSVYFVTTKCGQEQLPRETAIPFIYATWLSTVSTVKVSTVQTCQLLCGSALLSRLSPYMRTASVSQILCSCFCTCPCCVYVVYTGQWSRSSRPGDHWTNVLTADPLFADEKHAYCLQRSVSTQTSQSERKRDLTMSRF